MAVTIKSEREIQLMREAGKILAKVHEDLAQEVKAGMTSYQIDKICEEIVYQLTMKWFMVYQAKTKSLEMVI